MRAIAYRQDAKDILFRLAEQGRWITDFCREIGISRTAFERWKRDVDGFAEIVETAHAVYQSWWEERGRAAMSMPSREFNSAVWIFQMKCRFPEEWREKSHIETVDATPKAVFVAPDQYQSINEWSEAYQSGANQNGNNT